MREERFNLIFNGKVEPDIDLDDARATLEGLFDFDPGNQIDFFDGESIVLGKNMIAATANAFKQALADAGIITHLLAADDTIAVKEIHTPRLEQRRENPDRRAKFRSGTIVPDRRVSKERSG